MNKKWTGKQRNKKKKNCQTIRVGRKHVSIRDVKLRLISNILNKSELLKTDNQGEPIYPNRGMPKSRYFPESNGLTRKTLLLEEVFTTTQGMLIMFLISLSTCKQIIMSQEAQLVFLKNIDVLKSHLSAREKITFDYL